MPISSDPPPARSARPARALEIFLWVLSVVALAWVGYQWIDAALFQHGAQVALEAAGSPERSPMGALPGAASPDLPAAKPLAPGTPIARLEIPRLGIEAVVAEGDENAVLRRAIGHLPETALPGEEGNVALAGHRDTFFRGLGEIREGDFVVLDSGGRRDRYRVSWTDVVDPSRIEVTLPTPTPSLTLITCYPFRWIGPAPLRFVVRAQLAPDDAPVEGPSPVRGTETALRPST